jgi:hypothetical protein
MTPHCIGWNQHQNYDICKSHAACSLAHHGKEKQSA